MAEINLDNVRAQYELLSVLDYNLKRRVVETIRRKAVPPVTIDALSGIDLAVADGSRLGLVGANGAGKSTLLAIMAGVLPPTSGSVEVHGRVLALVGGVDRLEPASLLAVDEARLRAAGVSRPKISYLRDLAELNAGAHDVVATCRLLVEALRRAAK